ncbi:MAG: hypothetical protein WA584_01785 [Pyrinomonadaceae bacterium]
MFELNLKNAGSVIIFILLSALFAFGQTENPPADMETILKKTEAQTNNYRDEFKNLLSEETKTFELFDKDGQVKKRSVVQSNFIIFQSLKDEKISSEYRDVFKVDDKNIGDSQKRSADLFEQLSKAKSVRQELEKIQKESSRYDKHLEISGLTLYESPIIAGGVRESFEFRISGNETLDGADVLVIEYRQIKPSPYILIDEKNANESQTVLNFKLDLPKLLNKSNVFLRGKLWIDVQTFQIRREERELTANLENGAKPIVILRDEYEYQASDFGILVPKKITYTFYTVKSKDKGANVIANLDTKATFEYGKFRKSNIDVKIEDEN